MKKALTILLAFLLLLQASCIVKDNYKESDIFSEFETEKGFGVFHLPPVLFKIALSISDESNVNSKDLMNKIDVVKVLFFEESDNTMPLAELKKSVSKKVKEHNYNLLTQIAQESNNISIFIIDQDELIREVLITIVSEKEYIGLNLVGELTKDDVMEVYKAVNLDNIKNYNK